MEFSFDLNIILVPLAFILGFVALASGGWLVVASYICFRSEITRSMNMDLEMVKVAKPRQKDKAESAEKWKEEVGAMEQLIASLGSIRDKKSLFHKFLYGEPLIALELAVSSKSEEIVFYVAFPRRFRENIEKQIHGFFPSAVIEKTGDYNIFSPGSSTSAAILKLKRRNYLPIKTYASMNVDPLSGISNALSKLENTREGAAIQLIIKPASGDWRKSGRLLARKMQQGKHFEEVYSGSVLQSAGKELGKFAKETMSSVSKDKEKALETEKNKISQLTPEEQELIKAIETKSNKTGFLVNIRLLASSETQERAEQILAQMENAFSQFENADINSFKAKRSGMLGRSWQKELVYDFVFRNFSAEDSVVLNSEELASVFHFPISTTETPKVKWVKSGEAPPPAELPKEGLLLGFNDYRGIKADVYLADDDRRRHIYCIGQTGTGKSAFLENLAVQDAAEKNGFCFIDPHGDSIEKILTTIPPERAEDVIVFDPADTGRPFGLNMLEYDREEQKTFVINEMINIFDKLYDLKATGGPMFEQYMRNAMLLVMDDPETGSTLMEIPKVMADEDFRRMKLKRCKNPVVVDFWVKEAEKAGGEAALANMVPYITSKLTPFISNDMMRPIIAQQKSTLNFRSIMDEGKILLINLSKGKIGEINSYLLGMVIVGKILMAALSRVDVPEEERKDFYLYIDEFQNVTTDSISQILSEARKYRLNLVIVHQFIGQLEEKISKAVFGNVGSILSFRIGPEDAEFMEKQFDPVFTANDLINVDNYKAFIRMLINNQASKPFNLKTYPPKVGDKEVAQAFKELSRLKYGRDREIVNREIMERAKLANSLAGAPVK